MRYFDKYYRVLGLPNGADDSEIKSAYRKLAKRYHPDVSGSAGTRADFIRVNEAYEVLMKRDAMVQEAIKRSRARAESRRHRNPTPKNPRERAEAHANMRYDDFVKTPLYKTAMGMDSAFDYIFIFAGALMILAPIFGYVMETIRPENPNKEPEFHFLPIFLVCAFLYGMIYFLFKLIRIIQYQE